MKGRHEINIIFLHTHTHIYIYMQDLRCNKVWMELWNFVVLPSRGRTGIPKWVKYKSMGCEVSIELPNKWYKDDTFLGFALFFSFAPLDVDDEKKMHLGFSELSISQGDQFILVDDIFLEYDIYGGDKGLDALGLYFYPQNHIPNEYRSKRWKYFKARCEGGEHRIKSFGMHLIYAQAQNNHKKRSRNHVF